MDLRRDNDFSASASRGPGLLTGWVVFCLAIAAGAGTLFNGFTIDDEEILIHSDRVHQLSNQKAIWLTDWWEVDRRPFVDRHMDRLYRPLALFTFSLNHAVHGLKPLGYHVVNVLLHGLASVLVWMLASQLLMRMGDVPSARVASTVGGLLFAVHPIHVEAYASVVGRADLLAAVSVLTGTLLFLRQSNCPGVFWYWAIPICLAAGLLSKESGLILAFWVVILTVWRLRESSSPRPYVALYAGLLVSFAGYMLLRSIACGGAAPEVANTGALDNPLVGASLAERVWTPFKLLALYLGLMIWPARLCADYSLGAIGLASSPLDWGVAAGLTVVAFSMLTIVMGWRRRSFTSLLVVLLFSAYAMFSNSFLLIGALAGERFFYLPSVVVCIGTGLAFERIWKALGRRESSGLRRLLGTGLVAAMILLTMRTGLRNHDWRDTRTIMAATVRDFPSSARGHWATGQFLLKDGEFDEAMTHLERAVNLSPHSARFYQTLSLAYWAKDDRQKAQASAEAALAMLPNDRASRWILYSLNSPTPQAYLSNAEFQQATLETNVPTQEDETSIRSAARLAVKEGNAPLAAELYGRLVQLAPDDIGIRHQWGVQLTHVNEMDQARRAFEEVIRRQDAHWAAHTNLATLLAEQGRYNDATIHAERACVLSSNRLEAVHNLAYVQAKSGRFQAAASAYGHILDAIPTDDPRRPMWEWSLASARAAIPSDNQKQVN
jgi:Flp pilus assembly protein TadD